MAVPVNETFFGSLGSTIYLGRSAGIPAWVPAAGTVADVSLNTPSQGLGAPYASTDQAFGRSWSGRAYAKWWGTYGRTVGGAGGHGDGAQNWLVAYNIETRLYYVEKESCAVFHAADGYVGDPTTGWMWDSTAGTTMQVGEPFTSHFYGIQVAVPPAARTGAPNGWLVTPTRGSLADGGQRATFQGHRFALGQDVQWAAHSTPHAKRNEHSPSWYDSLRNRVCFVSDWPCSTISWTKMDDATKGTVAITNGDITGYYFVGAYHAAQDVYMIVRNYTGVADSSLTTGLNITVLDPVTGNKYRPTATGTAPPITEEGAWAWAEEWDAWGYYPGVGGNDFYLLKRTGDPKGNNWVWSKQTVTGTARTYFTSGGSGLPLNRLTFVAALGIFLWEPDYDVPAQAFNVSQPVVDFQPLRSGGTVASLIANFSGSGFQLLTTAPGTPTYKASAHAGTSWDAATATLWIFGAETHGLAADMDNAVYGWRAADGLFIKHYDADDPAGYVMDSSGIYWSSAAHIRPWGTHTFRRARWIAAERSFEFAYDPEAHSSWAPIFEGAGQTTADRQPQMWKYNTATGLWSHSAPGATEAFLMDANNYTFAAGWHATYGWFTQDGATWSWLSPAGVKTSGDVFNKSYSGYQDYLHVFGDIAYHVGGSGSTYIYSRHPLANLAASARFAAADYPLMSGKSMSNAASVLRPDGKILIFPIAGTTLYAFLLDPELNTLTDTGFTLTGLNATGNYDLACEWSVAHNCVIMLSRRFSPNRVYAFRP